MVFNKREDYREKDPFSQNKRRNKRKYFVFPIDKRRNIFHEYIEESHDPIARNDQPQGGASFSKSKALKQGAAYCHKNSRVYYLQKKVSRKILLFIPCKGKFPVLKQSVM